MAPFLEKRQAALREIVPRLGAYWYGREPDILIGLSSFNPLSFEPHMEGVLEFGTDVLLRV